VKRAIVTVAALVVCASLASVAAAQTPAQVAKFNRYLSKHPGAAQQFAANGGTYNAAGYPGSYSGTQNYANTYSTQYQKNLATYENYMATHPGVAQLAANGYGSPYGSYYPGAQTYPGAYPNPMQQLAANPLMAIVAPLMGSSPGLQNYMGNYGGAGVPVAQAPYYGGGYPVSQAPYAGSGYPMEEPPCPRGGGYGAYGAGPYGASGYGVDPYAAGNPYQGGHFRYGHGRYMGGSTAFGNPGGYFGRHNSYFGGGAGRSQALAMGAASSGPWHHHGHWGH
jgi:hypothetical protein